jgi:DNA primase
MDASEGPRMIDITESWDSIIHRTGNEHLRRGRGRCPFCESQTGFSVHNEKGFHCFACGVHGDKVSFIRQFHKCDFKDALRFFGLEPGRPPVPDPAIIRRKKVRDGLQRWKRTLQKQLNFEHYVREKVTVQALRKLRKDPEDEWAWNWLQWAYTGLDSIAHKLDVLNGSESDQVEAYKQLRKTA